MEIIKNLIQVNWKDPGLGSLSTTRQRVAACRLDSTQMNPSTQLNTTQTNSSNMSPVCVGCLFSQLKEELGYLLQCTTASYIQLYTVRVYTINLTYV